MPREVRYAYADPPYLGCCGHYGHNHGDDGRCWDVLTTHALLVERLEADFPDGWALSLSEPSLRLILPLCPDDSRVAAWVKPFASYKPNVNPAYTWEPVIFRGGREKRDRAEPTVRDHLACNVTLKRGFTGAKPEAFAIWILDLLGVQEGADIVDLFAGSGGVQRAWDAYRGRPVDGEVPNLFGTA